MVAKDLQDRKVYVSKGYKELVPYEKAKIDDLSSLHGRDSQLNIGKLTDGANHVAYGDHYT